MASNEVERVEKDSGEVIGALAGAAAVAALLPAVLIAGVVVAVLRLAHRQWWWAGIPAVVAVAVVALYPGFGAALHAYVAGYSGVIGHVSHHGHPVGVGGILGDLVPFSLPLGCLLGTLGGALAERKWPLSGVPGKARAGKPHHGRGMRPDAPTATRREVRDLAVKGAEDRRLVLGKVHGRWVAAGPEDHVVAIAPTGSGKTSALVIPAVLRLGGPLVVTSSKGDIVEDSFGTGTLAWRSQMGACHVFDPSGSTPYPCVPWSPLGRAIEWQGALQVARSMLSAANAGEGAESSTSRFFSERAEQSLAPLLHAAALSDGEFDLGDVHRWVRRRDWSQPEALLSGEALEALENLTVGSKESLGDTLGKIGTILRAYEDPTVRRNTAEAIWSPGELLEGSDTLYIIYGPDVARLAPVFTALVDEVIDTARRKALRDGPLDPELWLLLDEAGTGLALPDLPATLARIRGEGIRALTAWQDLGQIRKLYGDEGRSGILGNSAAQVWWPPDDGDTARYLSDTLGHQQVKQVSKSRTKGKGDTSESESIGTLTVLDAGEARTMSGPLLLYRGKPPAQLETVPYFADRMLRRKSRNMESGLSDLCRV